METVQILCTGGTFDKIYGSGAGVRNFSFPPEKSSVEEILARLNVANAIVTYDPHKAKDSLDMTDEDRTAIVAWCSKALQDRVVIIHGTDTMLDTARVVAKNCTNKVVILTGALQPACMKVSDAEFNLGGAIAAAQASSPGVYIFMNGRLFVWDSCRKNPKTGVFEPISDKNFDQNIEA